MKLNPDTYKGNAFSFNLETGCDMCCVCSFFIYASKVRCTKYVKCTQVMAKTCPNFRWFFQIFYATKTTRRVHQFTKKTRSVYRQNRSINRQTGRFIDLIQTIGWFKFCTEFWLVLSIFTHFTIPALSGFRCHIYFSNPDQSYTVHQLIIRSVIVKHKNASNNGCWKMITRDYTILN
jgi:hypothetical protein